jgi:general secretion pathway protein G
MRARPRGFTLIELLIVVAILGVLVAIAIPALSASLQRARQKRTMVELRELATAVSAYATDFPFMPQVGPGNAEILIPFVVPTYIRHLSGNDAWRQPIRYEADGLSYTLTSLGADGLAQAGLTFGPTTSFAADIVLANGVFVQWPDGMQTN